MAKDGSGFPSLPVLICCGFSSWQAIQAIATNNKANIFIRI
jgi:hypothetical protein